MIRVIRAIRSLVDSVFVQFVSFVVLSILSSCKNMSLKYMSLCHSVSYLILSVKCFHSRQMSRAQIACELTAFWLAKGAL